MKMLILTKTVRKGKAPADFHYQVWEDGKPIAERRSNRDYVACHVYQCTPGVFKAERFYGKVANIDRKLTVPYALAMINDEH